MSSETTSRLKVCIGITTFNRARILRKACQLALEQDYDNKEVVVVDDASTDETPSIRAEFPTIRWIRFEQNQGLREARNLMMRETDADLFCSLDDDSWFTAPDGLSQGVALFEQQQDLAAVGFEVLDNAHPTLSGNQGTRTATHFIGCGHLLRLSSVRDVGFYVPMPGKYGVEEKDLALRLIDAGYDVLSLDGVCVWHDKTFLARDVVNQHYSGVLNDLWLTLIRSPLIWLPMATAVKMAAHLRFAIGFGLKDEASLPVFDVEIRRQFGRWAFVSPTAKALGRFLVAGGPALLKRRPMSINGYRELQLRRQAGA